MNTDAKAGANLVDTKVDAKIKLSALWAAVMFLYLYVDVFMYFKPGVLADAMAGKVWAFQVSQGFLLAVIVLMTIPSLMVFLSVALKAVLNRWVNIIVGVLYIVITLGMAVGESYVFYIFGSIVEAALLFLIVFYAWTWPKTASNL